MKVYIGPYIHMFSVSQLEDWCFEKIYGKPRSRFDVLFESGLDFTESRWYINAIFKGLECCQLILDVTVNKIQSHRTVTNYITIDPYDTWSMDTTLAAIILPMLIQLKETTHGSCHVNNCDVPAHLRGPEDDYDSELIHDRWSWVLDEMIHSFTQINSDDWESKFFTNSHEYIKPDDEIVDQFTQLDFWPDAPSSFFKKGYDEENLRIQNGLKLFGLYYRGLWD